MFRSGRTRPAHAQSGGSEGLLRIRSLAASNLDFGSEQVTGYPEARSSGLRRAGQRDTKHRRGTIRPIHGFGRGISYCRDNSDPAIARLLGALLHVSGSIDDLQVRDAPVAQQCRPRSFAVISPDFEQGNAVIDLGILDQPFAGCEAAALLKNLQVPDMTARHNP
jgi:hypothetical protein